MKRITWPRSTAFTLLHAVVVISAIAAFGPVGLALALFNPFIGLGISNVNTAGDLEDQAEDYLPKLWKKGVEVGEQNTDFYAEFEGSANSSPIRIETDLSKGAGEEITFRNIAGLYGEGVEGDELGEDSAEEWRVGQWKLSVDWIRHFTRWNRRTEGKAALKGEINETMNVQLGEWLGRKKTERMQMMFNHKGGADNYVFANNKGSIDDLRSADTISMDLITSTGQILKTLGARPALVGMSGKNKINRFIYVATGEALVSLQNSPDYKQASREAGIRGADNVIFKGGFVDVNGHLIREYQPIDHDGYGAVGSPMNPKALLGVAITADNEVQDIKGGGSTEAAGKTAVLYYKWFSNYDYQFAPGDTLGAGSDEKYVLIYNKTGAAAGKMGFYAYETNNGNKLTPTKRLRETGDVTGNNIAYERIGDVQWNTGPWVNKHTDSHPAGSVVVETNKAGVPIGKTHVLGAFAAGRGYGAVRNERTFDTWSGGFVKDVWVNSVFGQSPFKRADGKCPNFLVVTHAITYQGLAIPTSITDDSVEALD